MDHLTCDICGKALLTDESVRYQARIQVFAAYDPLEITPDDLTRDAQADDMEVAMAVYRFEKASGLDIRRVNQRWAGLRTFAPDKVLVAGFDPRTEGFFWLAGQGGYGVQSSPAMAHMTTWLITGEQPPEDFLKIMSHADSLTPDRLL